MSKRIDVHIRQKAAFFIITEITGLLSGELYTGTT